MHFNEHHQVISTLTFSRHFLLRIWTVSLNFEEFCFIHLKLLYVSFLSFWHFCQVLTVGLEPTTVWVLITLLLALYTKCISYAGCSTSWATLAFTLLYFCLFVCFLRHFEIEFRSTNKHNFYTEVNLKCRLPGIGFEPILCTPYEWSSFLLFLWIIIYYHISQKSQ